ncbi:MAG: hypothetical protein ACYSW8_27040 [Planctomycetota bacterium]|jgi:hypothetical protein
MTVVNSVTRTQLTFEEPMDPTFVTAVIGWTAVVIGLLIAICNVFVCSRRTPTDKLTRARARVAKLLAKSGKLFDLPEIEYAEYDRLEPLPRCLASARMILEYMERPVIDLKSFRALIDTSKGMYRCANVTMLIKDMTPGAECVSVTFSTDALVSGWVNGFAIINERGDCMQREDFGPNRLRMKANDSFHFTYHLKN